MCVLAASVRSGAAHMEESPFTLELASTPGGLRSVLRNRSRTEASFRHSHPADPCRLTLKDPAGNIELPVEEAAEGGAPPEKDGAALLGPGASLVLHEERFIGPNREGGWALNWGTERFMGKHFGLRSGRYRARLAWNGLVSAEVEVVIGRVSKTKGKTPPPRP